MARILIVEDSPSVRTLVRTILEGEDHLIEEAADGVEALEAVERDVPDVIVLDLMMPRMDGWHFLTSLHDRGLRGSTRVIIISGKNDADSVERGRQEGVVAYFPKPFEPQALLEAVRRSLEDSPGELLKRRERIGDLVRLIRIVDELASTNEQDGRQDG